MAKARYKLMILVLGPLIGLVTYTVTGPWWLYLIVVAIFLAGLMSFSMDKAPDRSGYDKRADDGRGHGAGHEVSGGGDC
ncbi:MAG: hypothetical protein MK098_04510 [Marinovum sp.]|nr:hypothetical protein [Marinovum sp.]